MIKIKYVLIASLIAVAPPSYGYTPTAETILVIASQAINESHDLKKLTELSKAIQAYVSNPKNKKQMDTPAGQELLQLQLKLTNYSILKSKFNECIEDPKARLQIQERIADSYLKSRISPAIHCQAEMNKLLESQKNLEEIVAELKKQYSKKTSDSDTEREFALSFRHDLLKQGYKDAVRTYLDLNHRYERTDSKNETISAKQVIDRLFENESVGIPGSTAMSHFGSAEKDELIRYAANYQDQLTLHVKKVSTEDIRKKMNKEIESIHQQYNQIELETIEEHVVDGENFDEIAFNKYKDKGGTKAWVAQQLAENKKRTADREAKIAYYNNWTKESLSNMAQTPSGTLLFTDAISKYFTAPLDYKIDENVRFKQIPNAKTVELGIDEAKSQTIRYGHFLAEKDYNKPYFSNTKISLETIQEQVHDIVRNGPAATSQVLIAHPEYIGLVCNAINTINREETRAEKMQDIYIYGGSVVGGALLVTGVGSVIGAEVLAGTSAAAVLSTVATGSMVTGSVVSATQSVYFSNRLEDIQNQRRHLKAAYIGTSGQDLGALPELKKLYDEYREDESSLTLSVGCILIDDEVLFGLVRGAQSAKKIIVLQRAKLFIKRVAKNPSWNSKILKIVDQYGEAEASKFITSLSQLEKDPAAIEKMLDQAIASRSGLRRF